jgi:hypothetical protein
MWITDGNQNKYINSLGEQIPDGWYRGRYIIKGKSKWWVNPDGIRKFQQECPGVEWKRGMFYK